MDSQDGIPGRGAPFLIAIVAVALGCALAAGPGAAAPTEVVTCTTISTGGSYVLPMDVADTSSSGPCIRIESDDVVLEGRGHSVDGIDAGGTVGVEVVANNVTVRNLTVTDFDDGVVIDGDSNALVDAEVRTNDVAVRVAGGGEDNEVRDSTVARNARDGIRLGGNTNGTLVAGNSIRDNGGVGVGITTNRRDTVRDNVIHNSSFAGVDVADSSALVRNNTVRNTSGTGLRVSNGAVDAVGNTVVNSTGDGIRLDGFTSRSTVSNTTASGNGLAGIALRTAGQSAPSDVLIRDSRMIANGDGVLLDGARRTVIRNLTARDNAADGLRLDNGSNATVAGSAFRDNAVGINATAVARSAEVTVRGSVIAGNTDFGVRNGATAVLNATRNYWGTADGPGSTPPTDPDAPFVDIVTGAPANGGGDTVSEFPFVPVADFRGISNVQFDPFLAEAPGPDGSAPLAVTDCRVLNRSGERYRLAGALLDRDLAAVNNLTDQGFVTARGCLVVTADNVTVDGGGYTLGAGDLDNEFTHGVLVAGQAANVTVRNLTATGWSVGVGAIQGTDDTLVSGVTLRENELGLATEFAGQVTVTGSVASNSSRAGYIFFETAVRVTDSVARQNGPSTSTVDFRSGQSTTGGFLTDELEANVVFENVTAVGNTGPGIETYNSHGDIAVLNSTVRENALGIGLKAFLVGDIRLSNNVVADNDGAGVYTESGGPVTVDGDRVTGNAHGVMLAAASDHDLAGVVLANNTGDGLRVDTDRAELANVTVSGARIADNGIGVNVTAGVNASNSTLTGSDILDNAVGVHNANESVLNATGNYWGSSEGPSSEPPGDPDAPFADPVTGSLANGSGDSVSEGPTTPGVSNVHFDPVAATNRTAPGQAGSQQPGTGVRYTRTEIAQAKYGLDFANLSPQTSRQVEELYNRQPFAGARTPDAVLTREELAERRFGAPFRELHNRTRRVLIQRHFDAQFGDTGADGAVSRDEIAQAKYGLDFAELSAETSGQVEELYNRQPFDGLAPAQVRTREEIAEARFGLGLRELSRSSRLLVEREHHAQFVNTTGAAP